MSGSRYNIMPRCLWSRETSSLVLMHSISSLFQFAEAVEFNLCLSNIHQSDLHLKKLENPFFVFLSLKP